jgi:hypothetical protein
MGTVVIGTSVPVELAGLVESWVWENELAARELVFRIDRDDAA